MKSKSVHIFFITIVSVLFLFLSSCSSSKDALYECQISAFPTGEEPCDFVGGQIHACQITDKSYDPSQGIPDFCTEKCLERSGFLTSNNFWNTPLDTACIQGAVAHSRFAKPELSNFDRTIHEFEFGYEDEGFEEQSLKNDSELEEEGKESEKQCEFDSDCLDTCEEKNIADMYCDLTNYSCKKSKIISCIDQKEEFDGEEFSKTCNKNIECEIDKSILEEKNKEISRELKIYNDALGVTGPLTNKFQRECEKGAILITTKLVTDTSILILTYPTTTIDFIFDTAGKVIETGLGTLTSDSSKMSPEEYFVWACSTRDYLKNQEDLYHKKVSELVEKIRLYKEKVTSLKNQ